MGFLQPGQKRNRLLGVALVLGDVVLSRLQAIQHSLVIAHHVVDILQHGFQRTLDVSQRAVLGVQTDLNVNQGFMTGLVIGTAPG